MESRRGTGRGGVHGGGRGRHGAATFADAGSGRGLVVARFDPSVVAQPGASSSSTPLTSEEIISAAPEPLKKKRRRKIANVADDDAAEVDTTSANVVNPTFARIFRGGPRRRESDLPVLEEEEGVELDVPDMEEPDLDSGVAWLTSLGASDEPENVESEKADLEVGWLTSLSKPGQEPRVGVLPSAEGGGAELMPKPSATAEAYVGKALPIPPFWRTLSLEEVERRFRRERPALLDRWKRMAKDARRSEKRRKPKLKMPRSR